MTFLIKCSYIFPMHQHTPTKNSQCPRLIFPDACPHNIFVYTRSNDISVFCW